MMLEAVPSAYQVNATISLQRNMIPVILRTIFDDSMMLRQLEGSIVG